MTLEGGGIEVPTDMKDWPLFHNGVAAGLKIMPQIVSIGRYIIYCMSGEVGAYGTGKSSVVHQSDKQCLFSATQTGKLKIN